MLNIKNVATFIKIPNTPVSIHVLSYCCFFPFQPQVKSEPSQKNVTGNHNKKSEIVDPYEYVRNMGKGASMQPIRSKTASNLQSTGHSDALILWKASQSASMATLAKKKSTIPQPGKEVRMKSITN